MGVWEIGREVEVAWGIEANHGGGYQYRLCRKLPGQKNSDLTEECFQSNPLPFVGETQWLQYGPNESNRAEIMARRTSIGTVPEGSQWTRNPIPACNNGDCSDPQFPPPDVPSTFPTPVGFKGLNGPLDGWHIVDKVHVPNLEPGAYVLSWRWDCEQSAQVWSNCADVELKATITTTATTTTTTTTTIAATTTESVTLIQDLFKELNGPDQACRGESPKDNRRSYYGIYSVTSLEECQQRCTRVLDCKGIEYKGTRCEVWIREAGIEATKSVSGYRCMAFLGAASTAPSLLKISTPRYLKTRKVKGNSLLQQGAMQYNEVMNEL